MTGFILRSDRLQVELAAPGSVYQGSRFDWSGFVTQVTLDGTHTFCVPESYQAGAGIGGIGLCNEFGIDQPVGYDEARPGELFPKPGIGLLRKTEEAAYNFAHPYEIAQPFPIGLECSPDRARVVVEPLPCRGYALRLNKTFRVKENWLEITYELENTGSRAVLTHEYAHNFAGIDGQPVGPDYRLRFPVPVCREEGASVGLDNLAFTAEAVGFTGIPHHGLYFLPLTHILTEKPQWELQRLSSGVGMREYDDFCPMRVAVWGTLHVLSAEIFVPIDLQPGSKQAWARRYEFFD